MLKRYINFFAIALLACGARASASDFSLQANVSEDAVFVFENDRDRKSSSAGDADTKLLCDAPAIDDNNAEQQLAIVRNELAEVEEQLAWCAEGSEAAKALETRQNELKLQKLALRLEITQDAQESFLQVVETEQRDTKRRLDELEETVLLCGANLAQTQAGMIRLPKEMQTQMQEIYCDTNMIIAKLLAQSAPNVDASNFVNEIAVERRKMQCDNEALRARLKRIERFWQRVQHLPEAFVNMNNELSVLKKSMHIVHDPLAQFNGKANGSAGGNVAAEKFDIYGQDGNRLDKMTWEDAITFAAQKKCDLKRHGLDGYKLVLRDNDATRGSTVGIDSSPAKNISSASKNGAASKPNTVDEHEEDEDSGHDMNDTSSEDDEYHKKVLGKGVSQRKKRNDAGTQLLSTSADGNDKTSFDEDPNDCLPMSQVREQITNAIHKQTGKNVKFNLPNSPSTQEQRS